MYRLQGLYLIIYTPETWTATPIENGQKTTFPFKDGLFLSRYVGYATLRVL